MVLSILDGRQQRTTRVMSAELDSSNSLCATPDVRCTRCWYQHAPALRPLPVRERPTLRPTRLVCEEAVMPYIESKLGHATLRRTRPVLLVSTSCIICLLNLFRGTSFSWYWLRFVVLQNVCGRGFFLVPTLFRGTSVLQGFLFVFISEQLVVLGNPAPVTYKRKLRARTHKHTQNISSMLQERWRCWQWRESRWRWLGYISGAKVLQILKISKKY